MKRLAPLMFLALVGACSDGPTGPPPVRSVTILLGTTPVEEQTIQVGGSVKLTVRVEDRSGAEVTDRTVNWTSTAPSIATVDPAGQVTGVAPGEARVIATVEAAADTVRIIVAQPASAVKCEPGDPILDLSVGQVRSLSAAEAMRICLPGGASGAEYMYIPFHASGAAQRLAVEVAGGDIVRTADSASTSATPLTHGGPTLSRAATMALNPDQQFHLWLRRLEQSLLPAIRSGAPRTLGGAQGNLLPAALRVPSVGDTVRLNANSDACSSPNFRLSRVEAVSQRAIVVADTLNPAGGFTREEYRQFAVAFDTLVWPVTTRNFGTPSDLDGNQRVILFFTKAVNDLTPQNDATSYVGGFYHPRDLLPRTGTNGCAGSNEAEVLYQLVPDTARGGAFSKANVTRSTVGVLAHELQHLINSSRRAFVNNADRGEEVWLNEGLSHIAEELIFYAASGLAPEQNIDIQRIRSSEHIRNATNTYQISNLSRYISFLENPQNLSLSGEDDLPTRGGAWAFLRYAADRKTDPGAQQPLWFALVNSRTAGLENLRQALEISPLEWMQDWTVSVYTDDLGIPVGVQFQQPSWHFRSVIPVLLRSDTYPLRVHALRSGIEHQHTTTLKPGGSAYIRFGVAPGQTGAIRITSQQIQAPPRLRISIVRTR